MIAQSPLPAAPAAALLVANNPTAPTAQVSANSADMKLPGRSPTIDRGPAPVEPSRPQAMPTALVQAPPVSPAPATPTSSAQAKATQAKPASPKQATPPSPAQEIPAAPAPAMPAPPVPAKLATVSIAASSPNTAGDEDDDLATSPAAAPTQQQTPAGNALLSAGPVSAGLPAASEPTGAPSAKPGINPKNTGFGRSKQPSARSTDPSGPVASPEAKPTPEQTPLPTATVPFVPVPTQPVIGTEIPQRNEQSSSIDPSTPGAPTAQRGPAELGREKPGAPLPGPTPITPTEPTGATFVVPETPAAAAAPHGATTAPLPAVQTAAGPVAQAAPSTSPPSPAVQVAQAVAEPVRVVLAAPPQQSGAPHVTTIQLDPAELGRVQIRIERSTTDGPVKVELAAERPETLLRLIHDQPQLQQALDQAGIPQQGRSVSFSLAADGGGSSSPFTNLAGDGASNGNGQRSPQGYGNQSAPTNDADEAIPIPTWNRTGLDITA